jgi:rare lipoprotein A
MSTVQKIALRPGDGGIIRCLSRIHAQDCIASVYAVGDSSQAGTVTASGIFLNDNNLTTAHKELPFGSNVRVTNRSNGKSLVLMITDRGPSGKGCCIDVTKAAALALGFSDLAAVSVEPAP